MEDFKLITYSSANLDSPVVSKEISKDLEDFLGGFSIPSIYSDQELFTMLDWINLIDSFFVKGNSITPYFNKSKILFRSIISNDGIPPQFRAHIYIALSGSLDKIKLAAEKGEDSFKDIVIYEELLTPATLKLIKNDIDRTHFPQNRFLRNLIPGSVKGSTSGEVEFIVETSMAAIKLKQQLYRVLVICCSQNANLGYVQGMNSIAAALIYNFWSSEQQQYKAEGLLPKINFSDFEIVTVLTKFFEMNPTLNIQANQQETELVRRIDRLSIQIKLKMPDLFEHLTRNDVIF